MGWVNAPFRPYEVIHNLKHPITGAKEPYTVASIPSYGEDHIFAKEQALIDLVRDELAADRPCVVYFRQTATRDIQLRFERLLREHIPGANPFILKNTVDAERREAVIEAAVAKGCNVLICNPELTKTGLDLIFAPTLIFYEIIFNLSTMMQAAARSYRLNQTHAHCKVVYLYAEGTMEQTAVQLMSRKQRAAKLLTGEIGLTGLDALTEGEGGFEAALLDAIGRDETLLDPTALFKAEAKTGEIDQEDAAYWNVESTPETEPEIVALPAPVVEIAAEPLPTVTRIATPTYHDAICAYLETVHVVFDARKWESLRKELLERLASEPPHLCAWLREEQIVFPGCEQEVAEQLTALMQGHTEEAPKPVIEPPPVRKPRGEVIPFRRSDIPAPVFENAAVNQLALF